MGAWDATIRRDLEGMTVKSELLDMWRLKLTRVRAKLGVDEAAIAAQEKALGEARLPKPREAEGPRSTAEVLRVVREGGREGTVPDADRTPSAEMSRDRPRSTEIS